VDIQHQQHRRRPGAVIEQFVAYSDQHGWYFRRVRARIISNCGCLSLPPAAISDLTLENKIDYSNRKNIGIPLAINDKPHNLHKLEDWSAAQDSVPRNRVW
jgi:hypothetical protein